MSKDEEENEEEQQDEKGDYKKVKVKKAEAKDEWILSNQLWDS